MLIGRNLDPVFSRRSFLQGGLSTAMLMRCGVALAANSGGAPLTGTFPATVWYSRPPEDCPFAQSPTWRGIRFLGRYARYSHGDTWYPSWAMDGNLYSPWTDGSVNEVNSDSSGQGATTGQARIEGDNPLSLIISGARTYPGDPSPYGGRYPCGSLVHNGIWYYGTYCLDVSVPGLNWDVLGPFVGFRTSKDLGKTWIDTPHTPAAPIFGENSKNGGSVRFGSPHFVDFGKNMEHSPDGKAYLVAHGSALPDPYPRQANASWITGDQIYLARVEPGIENINDPAKFEFFAGRSDNGRPQWTRNFAEMRPLIDWNNHLGCVTATYIPGRNKFVMCATDGQNTISGYNTMILESDLITGPWRLVTYLRDFGEQAYFVNIPSKFVSEDGSRMWLCYAANFTNGSSTHYQSDPPGSGYGMVLQEMELFSS